MCSPDCEICPGPVPNSRRSGTWTSPRSARRRYGASVTGVAVAAALTLAACGSSDSSSSSSSSAAATTASTKPVRIAYLSFAVANSYDAPMLAAAQTVAKENNATINGLRREQRPQDAVRAAPDGDQLGDYDAIIVQPIFGTGLITGVQDAIAAGKKVVNLDQILGKDMSTDQPQVDGLSGNVVFVPTEIGAKVGRLVTQSCQENNLNPCKVGYLYDIKAPALDVAIRKVLRPGGGRRPRARGRPGRELLRAREGPRGDAEHAAGPPRPEPDRRIRPGHRGRRAGRREEEGRARGLRRQRPGIQGVAAGKWYGDVAQLPASEGRSRPRRPSRPCAPARRRVVSIRPPICRTAAWPPRRTSTSSPVSGRMTAWRLPGAHRVHRSRWPGSRRASGRSGPSTASASHRAGDRPRADRRERGRQVDAGQDHRRRHPAGPRPRGARRRSLSLRSPRDALVAGIATIEQEMTLAPKLTVEDNVFLGAEPRVGGVIARRALRRRYRALGSAPGFDFRRPRPAGRLRPAGSSRSRSCARCRGEPSSS